MFVKVLRLVRRKDKGYYKRNNLLSMRAPRDIPELLSL